MTKSARASTERERGTRTGRRPGRSTTREQILSAARSSFAKRGYEGTTLRGIGADAGVDPALVRRFFGSKEGLLTATLHVAMSPSERLAKTLEGDVDGVGERMVTYFLSVWDESPNREVLIGMIRSACTNPRAATLLRDFIANDVLGRLATSAADVDARWRATAIGSQLVGLAMVRYVVGIEPLKSASAEELQTLFGPTIERYGRGELGLSARRQEHKGLRRE